jgi:uncharacterized protein
MIAEELRKHLVSTAAERRVAELRIGSRYTAATLDDGNVGVAYTFRDTRAADPADLSGRRLPVGKTTTEILQYLQSDNGLERTMGLAVANAVANRRGAGQHEADILHVLSVGFLDRVGMVGYFGPLVAPLEKRVRELVIFERDTARAPRALPADRAIEELPHCDVAVITATALVFGDLDGLLEAAAVCREVALVGASTPLVPTVFGPYGVTLLSGVTVTDGPRIAQVVSDGGGMGAFGEGIRKVNLRP